MSNHGLVCSSFTCVKASVDLNILVVCTGRSVKPRPLSILPRVKASFGRNILLLVKGEVRQGVKPRPPSLFSLSTPHVTSIYQF